MEFSAYGELSSSMIGPVYFRCTSRGVANLSLFPIDRSNIQACAEDLPAYQNLIQLVNELDQYFHGDIFSFSSLIDWTGCPLFQAQVLKAACQIPYGSTTTYKDLATKIGNPKAYRAVASALASNPILLIIPCHRVIGCDGKLHGFAAPDGVLTKQRLLDMEKSTYEKSGRI